MSASRQASNGGVSGRNASSSEGGAGDKGEDGSSFVNDTLFLMITSGNVEGNNDRGDELLFNGLSILNGI